MAMKTMGCKAENSVMIGNSFNDDIIGAVNAGMSAVYLTKKLKDYEKENIAELGINLEIISNIGNIKDIL